MRPASRVAAALALFALAACQSAPPAAQGRTTTLGDITITTSGSAGIEAGYVN